MLSIRDLKREDAPAVEAIFALHWSEKEFRDRLIMRLTQYITNSPEIGESKLKYVVAEQNSEVVGIAGFRRTPEHMMEFTKTTNPAELYILVAKDKRHGIGKALVGKIIETAKSIGYTEIVLYSGETHQESWSFYDYLGFERVAPAEAPNGEPGYIWRTLL